MSTDTRSVVPTNELIQQVMAQASVDEVPEPLEPDVLLAVETVFDLPGGYLSPTGEVAVEAEVRELTGRDEELIAKAGSITKALGVVLARGLVRVGDIRADEMVLNNLLAGDRDYILLRIYSATFGQDLSGPRLCLQCQEEVDITVDLLTDVPVRRLSDPMDRRITVDCSVGPVTIDLPTGYTQKELMAAAQDKSLAELSTILLQNTITSINGKTVIGQQAALDLPIRDRRKINEVIATSNPGPQMSDVTTDCPNCGTSMEVPLSIAGLFQA